MGIGPTFDYFNLASNQGTILAGGEFEDHPDLDKAYFIGGEIFFNLEKTDFWLYPRNGLKWINNVRYFNDIEGSGRFVKLKSDFSVFMTPDLPVLLTLALRFGVETNVGDFPFYQSSFVGGGNNLRGFRLQRFAGNTGAYQNTELRIRLSRVRNYLFTGFVGLYGFIDHARVWAENTDFVSNEWHHGYGPGLWVTFFNAFMAAGEIGFSREGNYFYLRTGFFF
ncbi:MAG: BamA/TamA family outer membrane protein [Cyclobacteriaceae bacterium]|nr:BamA/TamA family outer membrane protein [Cyclobacteriaceae bacterium]